MPQRDSQIWQWLPQQKQKMTNWLNHSPSSRPLHCLGTQRTLTREDPRESYNNSWIHQVFRGTNTRSCSDLKANSQQVAW